MLSLEVPLDKTASYCCPQNWIILAKLLTTNKLNESLLNKALSFGPFHRQK